MRPYSDKTVEIVELVVPESPKVGDDVTLTCRFNLMGSNHRLYTVNWWRGKDQFYTYKGTTNDRKHAYSFQGIQVKVSESALPSLCWVSFVLRQVIIPSPMFVEMFLRQPSALRNQVP